MSADNNDSKFSFKNYIILAFCFILDYIYVLQEAAYRKLNSKIAKKIKKLQHWENITEETICFDKGNP